MLAPTVDVEDAIGRRTGPMDAGYRALVVSDHDRADGLEGVLQQGLWWEHW